MNKLWDLQASLNEPPLAWTNAEHVEKPVCCAQLTLCPGTPVPLQTALAQSPLHANYYQDTELYINRNLPKRGIENSGMGIEILVRIAIR